jgi:hypothetical protein
MTQDRQLTLCMWLPLVGTVSTVRVGSDLLGGCTPQFTAKHEVWLGAYFADDLNGVCIIPHLMDVSCACAPVCAAC